MTVEVFSRLEPVAGDWEALADEVEAAPWLRPGWIAAWERAFGRGSVEIVALRRNSRLVGLVSLERRLGVLSSTSNWHTPGFALLSENDEARRELARALFAKGGRRVVLAFVPSSDPSLEACRAAAEDARYRLIVRTVQRSPYIDVDGDWAAYAERRDAKLRRELRRRRRRLSEQGELGLDVADGSERLDEFLEEGFGVEGAGWKGDRGTAIASHPATRRFYVDIARWAARRGWLRLAFLRLDGRAIAFDYALEEGRTHYLLKTGYNPAYRAFGPGMIIREAMLSRAFSSGMRRYEFLGDATTWKLEWADGTRELKVLQGFAPSALGIVDWTAFAFGRPLAKRALAWRST
jgi:CelD/BcsL family acetyltransferase involved in cellulose biosynthesis